MKLRRRDFPDSPPDPAPDYTEWIKHRYDPGYYTGGRIPPYLRRKPDGNNYGWLLIFGALVVLAMMVGEINQEARPDIIALAGAAVVIQFLAGLKLLRGEQRRKRP